MDIITVTVADNMSESARNKLENAIKQKLCAASSVVFETDPKLLGGFIVSYGNTVYDYSVLSRLETAKAALTEEARNNA